VIGTHKLVSLVLWGKIFYNWILIVYACISYHSVCGLTDYGKGPENFRFCNLDYALPSHHGAVILLFQFTFIFKFVIVISVAMGCHYLHGWKGTRGCPLFIQILIYSLIFCISIYYMIWKNTVWKYWYENFLIFQICFEGKSLDGLCSGLSHKPWENHNGAISLAGR
jgi:hypothetical protein